MKSFFANPFLKFVAKKAVFYVIVTFVAMTFIFFVPRLMPSNPVDVMIARASTSYTLGMNMTAVRDEYLNYFGFNKPLFDQYITWWGQVLHGNLGVSFHYFPVPVASIIMGRLPFTLALVIPVLVISFLLGNWIGARAAFVGGKRSEITYFLSVFCNRLPTFWFGMVLVLVLAVQLSTALFGRSAVLFPTYGAYSFGLIPSLTSNISLDLTIFGDMLHHYILPFLSLFIVYLGGWATGMRSMVIHEMDSGYVRYSEQLGFRKKKSMSYAQRNAMLPQFTGLNLLFNALIGETVIVEVVFGWPGIGNLWYQAVFSVDYPLIFGCFLVTMVVVILGNFLIDILYGFIDPRIRSGAGR
jgi:peptide/nickel transport system permease protein